jgi:hypothetical protein
MYSVLRAFYYSHMPNETNLRMTHNTTTYSNRLWEKKALPRQSVSPQQTLSDKIHIGLSSSPPIVAWLPVFISPVICSQRRHQPLSLQDIHSDGCLVTFSLPINLQLHIDRHDRSSLLLHSQLHSYPIHPVRYSLTGTSESQACFTHPKRFFLHSNHSLTRRSVVRHGSS